MGLQLFQIPDRGRLWLHLLDQLLCCFWLDVGPARSFCHGSGPRRLHNCGYRKTNWNGLPISELVRRMVSGQCHEVSLRTGFNFCSMLAFLSSLSIRLGTAAACPSPLLGDVGRPFSAGWGIHTQYIRRGDPWSGRPGKVSDRTDSRWYRELVLLFFVFFCADFSTRRRIFG